MKKIKKLAVAASILSLCFIGGQAIAATNHGTTGNASTTHENNGSGMGVDICNAEEVIISGTVSEADLYSGQGIDVDTGNEVETVYGIGPVRYWESLGISRPEVGDTVSIVARKVIFSDESTKNITITITFTGTEEEVVYLRDENCLPYWRGGNSVD